MFITFSSSITRCSLGAGHAATGSSGAGHGGNGGSGTNQPRVGIAYGHVYEPAHFGCRGGGSNGGRGGGVISITIEDRIKIDGSIKADGEDAQGIYCGGGSGGSIYIKTNLIQGYGEVSVNGGHGFVGRCVDLNLPHFLLIDNKQMT